MISRENDSRSKPPPFRHAVRMMLGRDDELQRARTLLLESGWVTVTGPAGIGKTRLVGELARNHAANDNDVVVVDLRDVPPASALRVALENITESTVVSDSVVWNIGKLLAELRDPLLVFDHIEDARSELMSLWMRIRSQSNAAMIFVSQVALGITDEVIVRVAPLSIAPGGDIETLIRQRVQALDGAIEPNVDMNPLIRATGGNPLAAEVAAQAICGVGVANANELFEGLMASHEMYAAVVRTIALLDRTTLQVLIAASAFPDSFAIEDVRDALDTVDVSQAVSMLVRSSFAYTSGDTLFSLYPTVRRVVQESYDSERNAALERAAKATLTRATLREGESHDEYLARIRRLRTRLTSLLQTGLSVADLALAEPALVHLSRLVDVVGGNRELLELVDEAREHISLSQTMWGAYGDAALSWYDLGRAEKARNALGSPSALTGELRAQALRFARFLDGALGGTEECASYQDLSAYADEPPAIEPSTLRELTICKLKAQASTSAQHAGDFLTSGKYGQESLRAALAAGSSAEEVSALWRLVLFAAGQQQFEVALAHVARAVDGARRVGSPAMLFHSLRFQAICQSLQGNVVDLSTWHEAKSLVPHANDHEARFAVASTLVLGRHERFAELWTTLVRETSWHALTSTLSNSVDWSIMVCGFALVGEQELARKAFEQAQLRASHAESFSSRHHAACVSFVEAAWKTPDNGELRTATEKTLEPFLQHPLTQMLRASVELLHQHERRASLFLNETGTLVMGSLHVDLERKPVLRALVGHLASNHLRDPLHINSYAELAAELWKVQRVDESTRVRIRAAVANLRRLGIESIETVEDGYRLRPQLAVRIREHKN